ncbi:MAG: aspartyl protease family protein [Bacteroidota bacterium]
MVECIRNKVRNLSTLLLLCLGLMSMPYSAHAGFILEGDARMVRIPVEIQNNIILIPVSINGSFEMNFILDTGVKTTILTEPMVTSFLSLDSTTKVSIRGLGEGDAIEAVLARDVNLRLPGVFGKGMPLVVLPPDLISYSGMFGKPVYGIIGHAIFNQFVVRINYKQKYIELHNPFKYKQKRKSTVIPITLKKGKPYLNATFEDQYGQRMTTDWLIDTGASQALSLFDEDLKAPNPSLNTFLGKGLSGDVYGKLGRIESYVIESFQFDDVIAGYPEPSSLGSLKNGAWYGNMGAEIISRFDITFDYFRNKIYLRKGQNFKKAFTYNMSGLEIVAKGAYYNEFYIDYVRPGSSADLAGLKEGDQIVSINSSPTDEMGLQEIYSTLSGKPGSRVALRITRGDASIKKKFKLISEL